MLEVYEIGWGRYGEGSGFRERKVGGFWLLRL